MRSGTMVERISGKALQLALILVFWSLPLEGAQPLAMRTRASLEKVARLRLSGESDRALAVLQTLESEIGQESFQRNHLPYLKAVLLDESGQPETACEVFEELAGSFPLPENLLLHRIDCARPEQKRALYQEFLKAAGHPRYYRVLFQFASFLEQSGDLAEAKKRYDLVWRARSELWREAALQHARLHVLEGDQASAIKDLENLISRHEKGEVAHQAVIDLDRLQAGRKLDETRLRKRARIYMNQRDTGPARRLLQELLERFPRSVAIPQYLQQVGRSYVLDEDFRTAIQSYQTAYRYSPADATSIQSQYLVANTALRMDDFELARTTYQEVIREHPTSPYAVDARFNLADTYRWLRDLQAAEESATEALSIVNSVEKRRFYYFLARLYLEQKRFQESLQQLQRLERYSSRQLPSGVTREEIFYLKGVNLQALEKPEQADAAFQVAARNWDSYFGKLAQSESSSPPATERIQTDRHWLDRLLPPRPFAGDGEAEPRPSTPKERVAELLFLQLYDEAATEIRWAGSSLLRGVRSDYLFNRAYYGALGGLADESLTAAELLERTAFSGIPFERYPRLIQTLLYPRHFSGSIQRVARGYGVDPDLMLAVMKQESRFEREAFSPATARGLMQFMVPTARQLAGELHVDFSQPAQLFQPDFSIRLGGLYLSKLLDRFEGSPEKALAAYNGGADNVARWAAKLTWPRADLFVSNIGFRETKLYVLKVMGNYYTYRSLYRERPSADMEGEWLSWFQ